MHGIVESWPAEAEAVEPHEGPAFMQAELAPNRSLPNPAFTALMIAIAAISFSAGVLFITIGAWPVTPFSAWMPSWSGSPSGFPIATGGRANG